MKRRITLILSVLCLLALVIALASCGHEHAFKAEWASDATNHWHVCEVEGDECAEVSGKAAHTFAEKSKVEATCTAVGELTEACSVCGFEKKTEIPMIAHDYADATCTAPKTCKNCPATDGEALGHDEQYEVVPPTCTEAGYTAITCSRCDYTSTKDPVDALGHDEQYEVVPPTCTEAGVTNITCTRCDYTSTKDPVDALGHDEQYDVVPPTCTEAGVTNITCSRCDYTSTKDPVDALGHDEQYEVVDPTCTEAGITNITCSRCDYTSTRDPVDALGHDEKYEVIAPDCLNAGITNITCTRCDYTSTKDPVDELGHDEKYEVIAPDCLNAGITNVSCSRCDYTATKDPKDALGHDEQYEVIDPTCTEAGITNVSCSRCDYTATKDPKDALGHQMQAATCVAPSTCSRCKTYTEGEATGVHVYDVENEVVAPTCSAEGYTVYGCSAGACGLVEKRDYTARTAHTFYDVNEFDIIRCAVCEQTYRNVTTIVTTGDGKLCLGCGEEQCVCNVNVEWNGYVKPSAPEQLTAGVAFTKSDVPEKEAALEIGGGLIKLVSESEANYTITIGDNTITVSGTEVYVDLYKYESVKSVTITSDADAQVVFYEILK